MARSEAWLQGPVEGIGPYLQPAAHALVQALEDATAAAVLTPAQLWASPGGVASVGFHLRHMAGAIERLHAYARGEQLSEAQRAAQAREREPGDPPAEAAALLDELRATVERALAHMRAVPAEALLEPRQVGAMRLPSTVLGLLFHAGEHAQRHAGQLVTTTHIIAAVAHGHDEPSVAHPELTP